MGNKKYDDLPERSDPNYGKLYREKHKERLKILQRKYVEQKIKENPDFHKVKYDRRKASKYRERNIKYIREKNWEERGVIGITYEKFLEELEKQNGQCKICNKKMNKPQLDHDHDTGLYRGILCVSCNAGLGVYEKNKERFKQYLLEHHLNGSS